MSEFPPLTLRANGAVGLFVHYDEARTEEFCDCLRADRVGFDLNPPRVAHLAEPGKVIIAFGRKHPRVVARWLELAGEDVTIDPDVVITEDLYHPPVEQLLSLGELRRDERLDYTTLGLSRDHVPALIRMAADEQLHAGPQESRVVWAPVHAWRALAQLRAEEAIEPLVQLLRRTDEAMDDWVSDDLPKALAVFGAAALEPLAAYLANATHGEWSRVAAASAIGHVGGAHTDLRLDCIARLSAQLERFAEQSDTLNAHLVSPLWDLRAVEAMPVIERAFASGLVDESLLGDVEDVQIHFGLKTRREHPPKPNKLTKMGEEFRARWKAAGLPLPDGDWSETKTDRFAPPQPYRAPQKIGRNDPCPCGSGKKYKKCCGP